jgi:hypothetical protein
MYGFFAVLRFLPFTALSVSTDTNGCFANKPELDNIRYLSLTFSIDTGLRVILFSLILCVQLLVYHEELMKISPKEQQSVQLAQAGLFMNIDACGLCNNGRTDGRFSTMTWLFAVPAHFRPFEGSS